MESTSILVDTNVTTMNLQNPTTLTTNPTTQMSIDHAEPNGTTPNDEVVLHEQKNDSQPSTPTSSPMSSPAPLGEEQERRGFMGDLHKFMAEMGKPLSKIPIMGYKELDLFQLFKEVISYGGFNEVVKNVGTWSKIWKRLGNFDPSITDSSFRLKKNYERYLLDYEFKCYPDNRRAALESSPGTMKRSSSTNSLSSVEAELKAKSKAKKAKPRRTTSFPSLSSSMENIPVSPPSSTTSSQLPIILNNGELVIDALGVIVDRFPYVTERYTWPIGFTSTRLFQSYVSPDDKIKYTCQITDSGDKPQFVITPADDTANPVVAASPSAAWRAVLKRISAKTGQMLTDTTNGCHRFGLAHSVVASLLRELPILSMEQHQNKESQDNSDQSEESYSGRSRRSAKRKKISYMDSSSDDSGSEYYVPRTRNEAKFYNSLEEESFSAENFFMNMTREEIEDLESAVITLQGLKHQRVF